MPGVPARLDAFSLSRAAGSWPPSSTPWTLAPSQSFRRILTSLIGQKSPIGGSFPAV